MLDWLQPAVVKDVPFESYGIRTRRSTDRVDWPGARDYELELAGAVDQIVCWHQCPDGVTPPLRFQTQLLALNSCVQKYRSDQKTLLC